MDELTRVGDLLRYADGSRRRIREVTLPRTAPVPMGYHEIPFELALECMRKIHRGHSWTTMQEQDQRVLPALASGQDALLSAADVNHLKRGDTLSRDFPLLVSNLRGERSPEERQAHSESQLV